MERLKRLWNRRWFRRLRSEKAAVVALGVVSVYAVVGLAVGVFGLVDEADIVQRVGPNNQPGFLVSPSVEKRVDACEFWLSELERTLNASEGEDALRDLRFGQMRPRKAPVGVLRRELKEAWGVFDRIVEANDWEQPDVLADLVRLEAIVGRLWPEPTGCRGLLRRLEMSLGTDMQGRSIFLRALYSIDIALRVGAVTAVLAVGFGSLLGTAAGYFGGWVDYVVTWLYSTLSSIPSIILLMLLAYLLQDTAVEGTVVPLYVAFASTYWIGPCRVIRGETLKLRELEFVQAAEAMGFPRWYVMLRHVLPNTMHLMLVNASLLFVAAIKGEVILTYLGLGLQSGTSWGIMIDQSRSEVLNGFFWQIGTATALMFGLVLAFNVLADALQDVLDPRHVRES